MVKYHLPLCLMLALPVGCGSQPPAAPPLGAAHRLIAGVTEYEVHLPRPGGQQEQVWIYLPDAPKSNKIPCILIAAAGSSLFDGMALADGDRAEHFPYAQAGDAVVAYSVDGPLGNNPTDAGFIEAVKRFKDADGGVADAKAALDYALATVPLINPKRVYAVGHSSAATISLLVAENDPRIAACVAYAPACNLPHSLGQQTLGTLDTVVPGEADFLARFSPNARPSSLTCPVFLFHADDDSVIPAADVEEFAGIARRTNPHVTYTHVPSGEHYDSMLQVGIPDALSWLRTVPAKP